MLRFFNKYYPVRGLLFFLGESGLIYLSIWLAIHTFYSAQLNFDPEIRHILAGILPIVFIIQLSLYYHDLYNFQVKKKTFELSIRIIQAIAVAFIGLAIINLLFPFLILKKDIFFLGLFLLILFLVSWRLIYQFICQHDLFNERILLVGDGNLASLIGEEIRSNLDSGYVVKAVFSNPGKTQLAAKLGAEQYNSYEGLCEYAMANGIKKIVVALEERRGGSPWRPLLDCRMHGVKIFEGYSFCEVLSGKILARNTQPSWLIFSDGFRRYRMTVWSKRAADICLASLGIIISAPLQLGVGILVKITSPGPVFYKQSRVGQREKTFQVIKFRTMCCDAEEQSGAVWAENKDPRITSAGRVLRKLRLDELPQFWNVLKGEMSFVGPRPERPEFVEQLKQRLPYYGERHTVKPGITGWAQINYGYGASEEDALRKLEYDLFYIKNLSLILDIFIVLKTVKTVLGRVGAR
ncbi:TIGR03013 family XrtA/PEP-CTERM system glycosyltransferase [Desulfonatronospira sp.]|uniref:TIGR03013 family XrtA/PEP-CTERM system glycosyltransferase n=1 Tax=Desulfonatronospira sp. TaxID=1962951 RepID=UPI0025B81658|nr:TIGR03013 family XrtA/PEP-CTERM system glycosyltransferase [Desulfonatronospira sp.]